MAVWIAQAHGTIRDIHIPLTFGSTTSAGVCRFIRVTHQLKHLPGIRQRPTSVPSVAFALTQPIRQSNTSKAQTHAQLTAVHDTMHRSKEVFDADVQAALTQVSPLHDPIIRHRLVSGLTVVATRRITNTSEAISPTVKI